MPARRNVLALGGLAGGYALLAKLSPDQQERPANVADTHKVTAGNHHQHHGPAGQMVNTGVAPFSVQMPVPDDLRPARSTPAFDLYEVTLKNANAEIIPGVSTAVFAYNGRFLGPTIRTRPGRQVFVRYRNALDHAANVHLHGGHVPAGSDGHPLDLIEPNCSRLYNYPNKQPGATLWYHDHTHHMEAEHLYRGLHGFYLIESDDERRLKLPSGQYDVPIMIRDAWFDDTGALVFDPMQDPYSTRLTPLANGKVQPFFPVAARKYRFRILNASNHRSFHFNLGGLQMQQIASDGGLLPEPVTRTELLMSPAERIEVVVDFSGQAIGSHVVLDSAELGPIMRFDVVRRASDDSRVPSVLRPLPPLPPATVTREVTLGLSPDQQWFWIDGKPFDPHRVDNRIKRGTTEIWKITNVDDVFGGIEHSFHLHLVQFRVLDRDGAPPWAGESGLKDTVVIPGGTSVRVQATFADFTGRYTYHCHLMEHSSVFQMMAQMEIVP